MQNGLRHTKWPSSGRAAVPIILCLVAAGISTIAQPLLAIVAALCIVAFCAALGQPLQKIAWWVSLLALTAVWLTHPAFVRFDFVIASKTVLFSDLLLPLAALLSFRANPWPQPARTKVFIAVALLGLALGIFNGAKPLNIVNDMRGVVYLLSGYFIASNFKSSSLRKLLRPILGLVGSGAFLVLISAVHGNLDLAGRAETVVNATHESFDATRYLVPSTYLASAVLCCCLCWHLAGGGRLGRWKFAVFFSAVLLAMGFSRNDVLTLGAALLFTLLSKTPVKRALRLCGTVTAIGAVTLALVGAGTALLPGSGAMRFVNSQTTAYVARVLDGIKPSNQKVDSSAQARVLEDKYALESAAQSPVLGKGWGAEYRPPLPQIGQDRFWLSDGRYYVHNGYYRVLVKTGVVGLLAFIWFALSPLLGLRKRNIGRSAARSAELTAVGATLAGLMAATWVVPNPFGVAMGPVVGLLIGLISLDPYRTEPEALENLDVMPLIGPELASSEVG